MQSVFAWARMWHGAVPLAYALQAATTLAVAAALAWLWRSDASFALKAAALPLATILATPFSLDYDLMMLAPAIAFFAVDGLTRGFHAYEKTVLALVWLVPLVARGVAEISSLPLAVLAMALLFGLMLRRAVADSARSGGGVLRPAA